MIRVSRFPVEKREKGCAQYNLNQYNDTTGTNLLLVEFGERKKHVPLVDIDPRRLGLLDQGVQVAGGKAREGVGGAASGAPELQLAPGVGVEVLAVPVGWVGVWKGSAFELKNGGGGWWRRWWAQQNAACVWIVGSVVLAVPARKGKLDVRVWVGATGLDK